MECFCYFAQRARHDGPWQAGIGEENMARKLTDCQFLLEHWLSISQLPRKTSQEYISLETKRWKESSWAVFHVREEVGQETWWRQTMQICMNQKPQEFTCWNGTLSFPNRPRPSLPAEGNLEPEDDAEIEEGDNKGSTTEDSWSMSGELIYRHHEERRLKFYDPDNETSPIPLIYFNVMRQTQTKKKPCLWTYYQWFMFRSEGCHSCWGVDCDYKIPDPTNKTSWRTQVRKWKTYKDPKDYQTRQYLAWSLDTIIQGAKKDK